MNACYGQVQSEIDRTCKQDALFVIGNWKDNVTNTKEENVNALYT